MVLVVMRDQHIVDVFRKILVRISGDVRLVGVTEHRIDEYAGCIAFHENTSVAEVTPTNTAAGIALVLRWTVRREKRSERLIRGNSENVDNPAPRLRSRLQPE